MINHIRHSLHTSRDKLVILLSFDWTRPKDPPASLGHASILANLKKHNINVIPLSYSVNDKDFSPERVYERIQAYANKNTDLALGAFVWNEPYIQKILALAKKNNFLGRIILGGPQVSYVKQGIEKYYPTADIFIRGYAEQALTDLVLSNEKQAVIAGVHYAGTPDLGLSAKADLETLPSPFLTGIIPPQRFIRWETQRGCPFRCTFCQHRESDDSMKRRHFSQSRILKEIDWFINHPEIQDIAVLDPTFNAGSHYLSVINTLAEKGYKGKISLQCRTEMINTDFLDAIQRLNQSAHVVLELGLQTIHKEEGRIIQRINNIDRTRAVFRETKQRGIATEVSLIFGLPMQTVQSFQASIDFCKAQGVGKILAYPLMLLRGTPLYDQRHSLRLVESVVPAFNQINRLQEGIPHVISSPTFTFVEWQEMARIAGLLESYNNTSKISDALPQTFFGKTNVKPQCSFEGRLEVPEFLRVTPSHK